MSAATSPSQSSGETGAQTNSGWNDEVFVLSDEVRFAFHAAQQLCRRGDPGPYVLAGQWTLATYQALVNLETAWRLAFADGKIMLFGEPNFVHEVFTDTIEHEFIHGVEWNSHPDTPDVFKGPRGLRNLFSTCRATSRIWKLAPTSYGPDHGKEPDASFRSYTSKMKENGIVFEISYLNESYERLLSELKDWTTGEGLRALLAIGIKIDVEAGSQGNPMLHFVYRDTTPTSGSESPSSVFKAFGFGHGTNIAPRTSHHPPTYLPTVLRQKVNHNLPTLDGLVEYFEPADGEETELIIEIPVGAALFHDLHMDSFKEAKGITLTDAYVDDLKSKKWRLDLGYLRYQVEDIMKRESST